MARLRHCRGSIVEPSRDISVAILNSAQQDALLPGGASCHLSRVRPASSSIEKKIKGQLGQRRAKEISVAFERCSLFSMFVVASKKRMKQKEMKRAKVAER